jgi:transglutaminase-like putative cysteine protease
MNYRLTLATAAATMLASTALYSLFAGQSWFWAGAGATVVVAGTGALTRLRPLPVIVGLAASLAALLLYLNLVFAASRSWLGVIPTASSLGDLRDVAAQGMVDADRFSPPVPVTPGLLLLAAAGIGLAAVATDILGVRLRGSAVAGLPLLALFVVPTTTSASRSPVGTTIVFGLGVLGYLLILGVDSRERIRVWGRPVGLWRPERNPPSARTAPAAPAAPAARKAPAAPAARPAVTRPPDARALGQAGRRVGLASMVIAVCVPLLVPGLRVSHLIPAHVNLFGAAGQGLGGGGGAVVPNPLAAMNDDLHETQPVPVLTYHTSDPSPQYLQLYVLGNLTTTNWTIGPRLGPTASTAGKLPDAPGLTGAARYGVTTRVTFSHAAASATNAVSFLPVPYPPTRVSAAGRWQVDLGTSMVYGIGTALSGLSYTVNSNDVDPTGQQLSKAPAPPAAISGEYLGVPASFRSLTTLTDRVTRTATTAYDKAIALQEWFTQTGGFSYSLNTAVPSSGAGLTRFLTVTKRGYCQQFAFAMAVMARLLGIPSRVAVGFTAGTPTGTNTWVVKTSDAHAWPELYFQGAGWLRFEPTPSGVAGQGTATPPTYSVPVLPGTPAQAPSTAAGSLAAGSAGAKGGSAAISPHVRTASGGDTGPGAGGPGGGFPAEPAGIAALALLVVLLAAPRAGRSLLRQRRLMATGRPSPEDGGDAARAHAAWHEVLDDLTDYRIGRRPSESPRAIARRLTAELSLPSEAAGALARLALAEERASYAGSPGPATAYRSDLAAVRRGISASASRRARWQARLFPASVLMPLRAGAAQAAEAASRAHPSWRHHGPTGSPAGPAQPELTDQVAGPGAR